MRLLTLTILMLCSLTSHAAAQVYKWTDAQGRTHYSDIPPLDAKNLTQKNAAGNIVETDALPFETKLAIEKNPVVLFSYKECGDPCAEAEAYMKSRGIPYTLKNREEDKAELKSLTGDTQVPALIIGKQKAKVGFEQGGWSSALDAAGYPKSNPLKNLNKSPAKAAPKAPPAAPAAPATDNTQQESPAKY